ncbi:hypothetical protein EJV47_09485 [Hymenobacter gummosus]|uniref:DUF4833 domain-containing protein n=1 Tax=Hymenobacter gummosus TaxID=1776032 RepID=A0A3S0HPE9_9BACT|nr:hypothetical protein [Hymenobacter gummosus]RTQ50838.1 hypothetical protein EJV47_09485 [Hymenobacter gummosus]
MLLFLNSCCHCSDDGIELMHFRFDPDSLSSRGFRSAEIRTAYMIRYTDAQATELLDTLRQPPRQYMLPPDSAYFFVTYQPRSSIDFTFLLFGFGSTVNGKTVKSYRVIVPATGTSYAITDVDLALKNSDLPLSCGCSTVKRKSFILNGRKVDLKKRNEETILSR